MNLIHRRIFRHLLCYRHKRNKNALARSTHSNFMGNVQYVHASTNHYSISQTFVRAVQRILRIHVIRTWSRIDETIVKLLKAHVLRRQSEFSKGKKQGTGGNRDGPQKSNDFVVVYVF